MVLIIGTNIILYELFPLSLFLRHETRFLALPIISYSMVYTVPILLLRNNTEMKLNSYFEMLLHLEETCINTRY